MGSWLGGSLGYATDSARALPTKGSLGWRWIELGSAMMFSSRAALLLMSRDLRRALVSRGAR